MGAFDAAGFLVSLISMSVSVSLLLGGLALLKERLLTRYRARTLYQLGLLLTVLLLFPWRPALLLPKIALPAPQVVEAVALTEDASLPSTLSAQSSANADDPAAPGTAGAVSLEAAAKETSGDTTASRLNPSGCPFHQSKVRHPMGAGVVRGLDGGSA